MVFEVFTIALDIYHLKRCDQWLNGNLPGLISSVLHCKINPAIGKTIIDGNIS